MNGVLVVDKPSGMTSHDVVARVRKALGTRRVGHAGTLDPMATGVLVVLVGEATKLEPYLAADDKGYVARVSFGRATDTLDAEGRTTATGEVPEWLREEITGASAGRRIAEAVAGEEARTEQVPPAYSAIHVDGRRSYERARAGEDVRLPPRPVAVRRLTVIDGGVPEDGGDPWIAMRVEVSKGYYVRSLARDLGERLGVPAHLSFLRRVRSGAFTIDGAVSLGSGLLAEERGAGPLPDGRGTDLGAGLIPIVEAAGRALPVGRLTVEGALRARQGKTIGEGDFSEMPPVADASVWLDAGGGLVAIGARVAEPPSFVIHRGFAA